MSNDSDESDNSKDNLFIYSGNISILDSKTFKKYKVILAVVAFACWVSETIMVGVFGGFLSGFGTYFGMMRLKEGSPTMYNWVLQNPGWVEAGSIIITFWFSGVTLGGLFIVLISNFTMSAALDYIAESEGLVPNAERFSLGAFIRKIINFIVNGSKTIAAEFKSVKNSDIPSVETMPVAA